MDLNKISMFVVKYAKSIKTSIYAEEETKPEEILEEIEDETEEKTEDETEEVLEKKPKKLDPIFNQEFFQNIHPDLIKENGTPIVLYHGTQRPDRIGNFFYKSRATSGPSAFFTDDPDIASSYASGKRDTSLEQPTDYADWFKVKPKGFRTPINISRYWNFLSWEEKQRLAGTLPHIVRDEETNEFKYDQNEYGLSGKGHWDYIIKRHKGNVLEAAKDIWVDSAALYNEEEEFMKVLLLAGIDKVEYDDPWAKYPAVYPVYLNIKDPLDTANIPQAVVDALDKRSKKQKRIFDIGYGTDLWDKKYRDPIQWIENLKEDIQTGKSHSWTSIPDWVIKTLQSFSYDGIKDYGGKYNPDQHIIWIPFNPNQIKSATGNIGEYDPRKKNILAEKKILSKSGSYFKNIVNAWKNIKYATLETLKKDFEDSINKINKSIEVRQKKNIEVPEEQIKQEKIKLFKKLIKKEFNIIIDNIDPDIDMELYISNYENIPKYDKPTNVLRESLNFLQTSEKPTLFVELNNWFSSRFNNANKAEINWAVKESLKSLDKEKSIKDQEQNLYFILRTIQVFIRNKDRTYEKDINKITDITELKNMVDKLQPQLELPNQDQLREGIDGDYWDDLINEYGEFDEDRNLINEEEIEDRYQGAMEDASQIPEYDDSPPEFLMTKIDDYGNIYHLYNGQSISDFAYLGKGTKWCFRADTSYEQPPFDTAQHYLKEGDIWVIYKNGKPFRAIDLFSDAYMDVNDDSVEREELIKNFPEFYSMIRLSAKNKVKESEIKISIEDQIEKGILSREDGQFYYDTLLEETKKNLKRSEEAEEFEIITEILESNFINSKEDTAFFNELINKLFNLMKNDLEDFSDTFISLIRENILTFENNPDIYGKALELIVKNLLELQDSRETTYLMQNGYFKQFPELYKKAKEIIKTQYFNIPDYIERGLYESDEELFSLIDTVINENEEGKYSVILDLSQILAIKNKIEALQYLKKSNAFFNATKDDIELSNSYNTIQLIKNQVIFTDQEPFISNLINLIMNTYKGNENSRTNEGVQIIAYQLIKSNSITPAHPLYQKLKDFIDLKYAAIEATDIFSYEELKEREPKTYDFKREDNFLNNISNTFTQAQAIDREIKELILDKKVLSYENDPENFSFLIEKMLQSYLYSDYRGFDDTVGTLIFESYLTKETNLALYNKIVSHFSIALAKKIMVIFKEYMQEANPIAKDESLREYLTKIILRYEQMFYGETIYRNFLTYEVMTPEINENLYKKLQEKVNSFSKKEEPKQQEEPKLQEFDDLIQQPEEKEEPEIINAAIKSFTKSGSYFKEVVKSWKNIKYSQILKKYPEYLYHGTFAKNIPSIIEKGLLPSEETNWGGKLGEDSIGKVFFTESPEDTLYYTTIVFKEKIDSYEMASYPIVLRISFLASNFIKEEKDKKIWYTNEFIPSSNIDFLWVGEWKPLLEAKEIDDDLYISQKEDYIEDWEGKQYENVDKAIEDIYNSYGFLNVNSSKYKNNWYKTAQTNPIRRWLLDKLNDSDWEYLSEHLKEEGYDSRGGEDAKRAFYGFIEKQENFAKTEKENYSYGEPGIPREVYPEQYDIFVRLFSGGEIPESEEEKKPSFYDFIDEAEKEFGFTDNIYEAGYILPNGRMIDFSEKREGGPGGYRSLDHRAIERILPEEYGEYTDAMNSFIGMGAIRCNFSSNGYSSIDLQVRPTRNQDTIIKDAANGSTDFIVDIEINGEKKDLVYGTNAETPSMMRINGNKIINDIDRIFDDLELTASNNNWYKVAQSLEDYQSGNAENILNVMLEYNPHFNESTDEEKNKQCQ